MRLTTLLNAFDLPESASAASLHEQAPVWAVTTPKGCAVLKRTSSRHGEAIAAWSRALALGGVGIVVPLGGPLRLPDGTSEETWIMYPFVAGTRYRGEAHEIAAAGRLLGDIHAFEPSRSFGLSEHPSVRAFGRAELDELIASVQEAVSAAFPAHLAEVRALLAERSARYLQEVLPRVLATPLPLVNCSWDHKAANLVFLPGGAPVLIDPDNAARMPRLYDLALTALSFHLDAPLHDGPAGLLTSGQWRLFLKGYSQRVTLTAAERAAWPDVLLCAWMDESLWQLHAAATNWQDERLGPALLELLRLPHPFSLG